MRIIGIDPGLNHTGFGIIDHVGNKLTYVASGVINTDAKMDIADRLAVIHSGLCTVIEKYKPGVCSLEETIVNQNALSSLKLGHARGAIMVTIALAGIKIYEYSATKIKKTVVGTGRAEKEQIAHMVKVLLPAVTLSSKDEADALATAICHSSYAGSKMLV